MSSRFGSSSSVARPCSVMCRYHRSPSRTVSETRGSWRRYSRRLRPSSMFTSTRPSSQRYQVATVFGLPSGRTVPMMDGLGLASTCWSSSGSGGLGMVLRGTRSLRDGARGGEVDLDGVPDVRRVAAGEHDADRRAGAIGGVEDERVARAQARLREREAPEAVAHPRVGAGEEEDEVRVRGRHGGGQGVLERPGGLVVAGPPAQGDGGGPRRAGGGGGRAAGGRGRG